MLNYGDTEDDGLQLVREATNLALRHMSPRFQMWIEAAEAGRGKAPLLTGDRISIDMNYLLPIIRQQAPRDAMALHPGRPFIPLRANYDDMNYRANIYEDAIDIEMDHARYYPEFTSAITYMLYYGNAYVMPFWNTWMERVKQRLPSFDEAGNIQGFQESIYREMKSGLEVVCDPPWQWLVPPWGNHTYMKDYMIRRTLMTAAEMERRIDSGMYPDLAKNFDKKKLRTRPSHESVEYLQQFEKDIDVGYTCSEDEQYHVGVLYEYRDKDRWIDSWNLEIVLNPKDQEPRLFNIDTRMKGVAMLKMLPGSGANQFWGESWWEIIRDKALTGNLFVSVYAHKLLQASAQFKLYNPRAFDNEKIDHIGYGEILEVSDGWDRDLKEALMMFEQGDPPPGLLDYVQNILEDRISELAARPGIVSGQGPYPKTKGGTEIIQSNVQPQLEFSARYVEATYCVELAAIVASIYSSEASLPKLADAVGWEKAMQVMTPDAFTGVPGGFYPLFEGSDQVSKRDLKFQKLERFYSNVSTNPMVASNPVAQQIMIKKFAEHAEFDKDEVEGIVGLEGQAPGMPAPQGAQGEMGAAPTVTPNPQMPEGQVNAAAAAQGGNVQ